MRKFNVKDIKQHIDPIWYFENRIVQFNLRPKRSSDGWITTGLCPFHADRRPGSLSLNLETGSFRCWSCGAKGGDIIEFEKKLRNAPFAETIRALSIEFGGGQI